MESAMHQMYLSADADPQFIRQQQQQQQQQQQKILSGRNNQPQFAPQPMQYMAVEGSQQSYFVQPQYQQQLHNTNTQSMFVDPIYYRINGNQSYQHDIVYAPAASNPVESISNDHQVHMTYAQHVTQGAGFNQHAPAWQNQQDIDPRRMIYPQQSTNGPQHSQSVIGIHNNSQVPSQRNYSQTVQMAPSHIQPINNSSIGHRDQYDQSNGATFDRLDQNDRDSRNSGNPRERDNRDRRVNDRGVNHDRNNRNDRDPPRDRGNDRGSGRGNNNSTANAQNNNNAAASTGPRDSVVEDFRNTYGKGRQWEIRDLIGHIIPFCQDQHGSRFIQQRLEVANDVDKQTVFEEIIPSAVSLMTDVFGNYVIQKLFEYGTPDQCETLASLIMGQSVTLAMQMYGCRVIQKALEYVGTPRLIALVAEFDGQQVLRCVYDQNGNHVIQKCIEVVSRTARSASSEELSEYLSSRIQFIITAFRGQVKELSKHPYGCRVVQRILEHCTNAQKASVLEELRICCADLVQDQYGNYVIQHVMQHGWEADRAVLIREVQSHLLDFSQHKFASNVVEKCLQYANKNDRDAMIWGIINVTFDLNSPVDAKTGQCVLENMVRDPYANYVVQKVIDVSDEKQRGAIIRYVKDNIVQLRKYTYGKHIIVRLEKVSNEKF